MKIPYEEFAFYSKEVIAERMQAIEFLREGNLDLANLNPYTSYPLSTIIDLPTRVNPIESHKFFYGDCPIRSELFPNSPTTAEAYWNLLNAAVNNQSILSVYDFSLALTVAPDGKEVGSLHSETIEVRLDPNKKIADWSFFPRIDKKTNSKSRVDISIPAPSITAETATFRLFVDTTGLREKDEDFIAVTIYFSLLLEDYK